MPLIPVNTPRPLVWIVDDDPGASQFAEETLGTTYDFDKLLDGDSVFARISAGARRPDLLLVTWVMAGKEGDEMCRLLRSDARTSELPVVLMSAVRIERADVAKAFASGASDYVARPFEPDELRARVGSAVRAKRIADLARQEGRRLSTINRLGRALFEAKTDIPRILDELAIALTLSLSDGCEIQPLAGPVAFSAVVRHRGPPAGAAPAISETLPLSSREPLRGTVTVTRATGADPFDANDLATIVTCIEYASLAVESALRFEAERAAERAVNAERERISQFQHEMLGVVGHDLRAPLSAIVIGTEMLVTDMKDPADAYVVKRIEACAKRMTRMVDQLLDMTRARLGGGIPVVPQRTPLLPLIKAAMGELTMAHPGARFELVVGAEPIGRWDPDRLGQVVSNLLGNAVQYGLDGAPVTVAVTHADGLVRFSVHNELRGAPLSPEAITTLFEPYRRGGELQRNGNGLGLGLYIVREIVRAHGGTIDITSAASGTTFRVGLPAPGPPAG